MPYSVRPGKTEKFGDFLGQDHADSSAGAALQQRVRVLAEAVSSGPAFRRSPRLSIEHPPHPGGLDGVEQVINPLVQVQVDWRPVHQLTPSSANDQPKPAEPPFQLSRVLLEGREQPALTIARAVEDEVKAHKCLAEAGRAGHKRGRTGRTRLPPCRRSPGRPTMCAGSRVCRLPPRRGRQDGGKPRFRPLRAGRNAGRKGIRRRGVSAPAGPRRSLGGLVRAHRDDGIGDGELRRGGDLLASYSPIHKEVIGSTPSMPARSCRKRRNSRRRRVRPQRLEAVDDDDRRPVLADKVAHSLKYTAGPCRFAAIPRSS